MLDAASLRLTFLEKIKHILITTLITKYYTYPKSRQIRYKVAVFSITSITKDILWNVRFLFIKSKSFCKV
jgi:hypothetical protein